MLNRKCKSRLVDSEHIPLLEGLREILMNLRASSLMTVKRARRASTEADDDAWAEAATEAETEPAAEEAPGLIASSTDSDLAELADVTDAEAAGSGIIASSTAESDVAEAAAAEAAGTANRRSYVCPRCQRSFPWLGSLKRHLRSSVDCGRLEVVTHRKPDKKGAARAAPPRRTQERSPAMSSTEGAGGARCGHGGRARRRSQSNATGARASAPARKRRSYSFPAGAGTGGGSKKAAAAAECYKCGIMFPDKNALLQHINTCHGYPTMAALGLGTLSRSPSQSCSSTSFSCSGSSRSGQDAARAAPASRARARDAQEL